MNYIDDYFKQLVNHLKKKTKEEIYGDMVYQYKRLNQNIKNSLENYFEKFPYWGSLNESKEDFEHMRLIADSLKDHLDDFIHLYSKLGDYRSKLVLYSIMSNWYQYDFKMLNRSIEKSYGHYFDLDLIEPNSEEVIVDLGAYTGDTILDYIYTYGESDLKVVVEYCESKNKNKKSNKYFAFDNPKLKMIRSGAWEISIYPHLPYKYNSSEKMFSFYINFEKRNFECEVINKNSDIFIYIHRKTTDITEENYPVYSFDIVPNYNYSSNIFNPRNKIESLIKELFVTEKVFYQDNEVGEDIRNFLMFSSKK